MVDLRTVELPTVFTRLQAVAAGLSDRQLDRGLANGDLSAVRRGILRRSDPPDSDPPGSCTAGSGVPGFSWSTSVSLVLSSMTAEAVPLEIRAARLPCPDRQLVISHASAARLWGLPQPIGGWPSPEFTAVTGSNRSRRGLRVRVVRLDDDQIVHQDGLAFTTPDRTLADCLRSLPGRDGLAMVDDALHRGLITGPNVLNVLRGQSGWPGVGLARQVLALADFRRESPLESWSAWAFAHIEVPLPERQVEIRGPDGRRLGRADCWWLSGRVVGEADGRAKYALAAAARGGNAEALLDVLQAERHREQRLREVGAEVVRWGTRDVLDEPAARSLGHRILDAIKLGQERDRFTGVVVPAPRPVPTETRKTRPNQVATGRGAGMEARRAAGRTGRQCR